MFLEGETFMSIGISPPGMLTNRKRLSFCLHNCWNPRLKTQSDSSHAADPRHGITFFLFVRRVGQVLSGKE